MMDRRTARDTAFSLIFESEFQKELLPEELYAAEREARGFEDDEYVRNVFFGVMQHREEIDGKIEAHAVGWKTKRMSKVVLAALRLSVYEMMHFEEAELPYRVSINEAIELVKKYETGDAPKFTNGILSAVATELGKKEATGTNAD